MPLGARVEELLTPQSLAHQEITRKDGEIQHLLEKEVRGRLMGGERVSSTSSRRSRDK